MAEAGKGSSLERTTQRLCAMYPRMYPWKMRFARMHSSSSLSIFCSPLIATAAASVSNGSRFGFLFAAAAAADDDEAEADAAADVGAAADPESAAVNRCAFRKRFRYTKVLSFSRMRKMPFLMKNS